METKQRSFVKATIWTLIGLVVMGAVGLYFTGSLATGGAMALINAAIGFLTYIFYERAWAMVRWGRV